MHKFYLVLAAALCGTASIAYADPKCAEFQKTYDALLIRAQKKDKDAMFELSKIYCSACGGSSVDCPAEAIKWLKAAADNGNEAAKALAYKVSKSIDLSEEGKTFFYLSEEEKIGDFVFRSYQDDATDLAYFEILKNGQVAFSKGRDGSYFHGKIYQKSILDDKFPTLQVSFYGGGSSDSVDVLYFSLGTTLEMKLHMTEGGYFKDVQEGKDGIYRWRLSDTTFRYWNTSGATSPCPNVILRLSEGKLVLDLEAMKKSPPTDQKIQQWLQDLDKDIKRNIEDPDFQRRGGKWEGKYYLSYLLWGMALDLIYQGNPEYARKWFDLAWKKDVPGKQKFINELKWQISKSPFWEKLQGPTEVAFGKFNPNDELTRETACQWGRIDSAKYAQLKTATETFVKAKADLYSKSSGVSIGDSKYSKKHLMYDFSRDLRRACNYELNHRPRGPDLEAKDTELNQFYSKIMHELKPEKQAELRTLERLWIKYKEAWVSYLDELTEGKPEHDEVIATKKVVLTEEQLADLKKLYP